MKKNWDRKKYKKKWDKGNKEKRKKYKKKWDKDNKEKRKEYDKKWHQKNPKYYKRYYEKNPQKVKKRIKKWRDENKDYVNFINLRRHTLKKNAKGSHTFQEWLDLKEKCNYICQICGLKEPFENQYFKYLTEDHKIPLTKGGTDYIENIQPLCQSCNAKKHNKIIKVEK